MRLTPMQRAIAADDMAFVLVTMTEAVALGLDLPFLFARTWPFALYPTEIMRLVRARAGR